MVLFAERDDTLCGDTGNVIMVGVGWRRPLAAGGGATNNPEKTPPCEHRRLK